MKNIIFLASTLLFALGTIAAPAAEAEALGRIPVPPYCYEECTSGWLTAIPLSAVRGTAGFGDPVFGFESREGTGMVDRWRVRLDGGPSGGFGERAGGGAGRGWVEGAVNEGSLIDFLFWASSEV
ncbi:uncharacterized protein MYCGRDRAFT_95833 [Zymoseptoria tritici IPO323]|uniref:Uncharacterized protein n=1 Tax=Zymoseptoria tritici (strain CBS 115943 / IPO323) TaxID=336722 RepID=F9XJD3_ZYMTI|nr:uncharacterized protein MYCGRDRAFT_95833 [Zymoseptoria tritici IPO323]EGP84435.1 hypothetical protein MYCGRDRAFT_95833 [Zymoseptoria tritici IPO323]